MIYNCNDDDDDDDEKAAFLLIKQLFKVLSTRAKTRPQPWLPALIDDLSMTMCFSASMKI